MKKIQKKSLIIAAGIIGVLGVAGGTPLIAEAATTTISSQISSTISLFTTSVNVSINATPTGAGVQTIANDVVTVSTNDTAGYTLKLGETTASQDLVSGSDTIAHVTGNQSAPSVETANSWGYRVDGVANFSAGTTVAVSNAAISPTIDFAAIPVTASPDTIKTTATTASNDVTNVWYGVAVNTTAPSGLYTNSVTYTATAN